MSQLSRNGESNNSNNATIAIKMDLNNNRHLNGDTIKQMKMNISLNNETKQQQLQEDNEWQVNASQFSQFTCNPVRKLVEQMKIEPNPDLQMIALSIGDPTIMSHIGKPDTVTNAIVKCVQDKKFDGYTPSYGTETARQAIARYASRPEKLIYKSSDILLTNGCSQALDLCITVLANPGQNILIPRPGFSIYKTLSGTLGINVKYYDLIEDQNWQIDLKKMESLIDSQTVGIIVNNPSNPCGSNYSRQHLCDIIRLAEKHKLTIIADEVYGDMVFPGNEFTYMSELSDKVPVLSCNALSKRFILPGWRFGWIAIHDPKNHLKNVRAGFNDLTTRILGPNSLVQAALPDILENTPQEYFENVMRIISENANIVYDCLSKLPGLKPRKPAGAMYMMVGIELEKFPDIPTDLDFVQMLIKEKSVFCLPASVFECPNYFRIVLTMQKEKIMEACKRISQFVLDHYMRI